MKSSCYFTGRVSDSGTGLNAESQRNAEKAEIGKAESRNMKRRDGERGPLDFCFLLSQFQLFPRRTSANLCASALKGELAEAAFGSRISFGFRIWAAIAIA